MLLTMVVLGIQRRCSPDGGALIFQNGYASQRGFDALALQTKNPDFVILVFRTLRTIQVLIRNGHPPVCHLGVVGVLVTLSKFSDFADLPSR